MEKNNYKNIGLGLIGSIKVWIARKQAENFKTVMDRIEHENGEVDYTEAIKLAQEIIYKRQVNRATRDAKRAFHRVQRAGAGWNCKDDYVEYYLKENNLSKPQIPKKTDITGQEQSDMRECGFKEPNTLIKDLRYMAQNGNPNTNETTGTMQEKGFYPGGDFLQPDKSDR